MYQTIPVRYLDAWLEQGYTGRLIDLRTPEEYNVSHLCEAENIPFLWLQDNRQTLTGERPLLCGCSWRPCAKSWNAEKTGSNTYKHTSESAIGCSASSK